MKSRHAVPLLLAVLFLAGCDSVGSVKKFLAKLPATDMATAEHTFSSPLWSVDVNAQDIAIDEDGLFDVKMISADLRIPLWGVKSTTKFGGIKQIPTPEQRAAADAIRAQLRDARAKAAAAKAEKAAREAEKAIAK